MTANRAWFSKVANGAPSFSWNDAIDDADSTISSPKPSNSRKIAMIRCHDVIGRSSQSLAVRRTVDSGEESRPLAREAASAGLPAWLPPDGSVAVTGLVPAREPRLRKRCRGRRRS